MTSIRTKKIIQILVTAVFIMIGPLISIPGENIGHYLSSGVSSAYAFTAEEYVNLGKQALEVHNIVTANTNFKSALLEDNTNHEANFYYAVTRILALVDSPEFNNLLDAFGVDAAGRDFYYWTADLPHDLEGKIDLPANSPTTYEIIAFIENTMMPEIEGALANLDQLEDTDSEYFEPITIVTALMTNSDTDVEADYGDVAMYRSSLQFFKALILIITTYDLNADIDNIAGKAKNDILNIKADIIDAYPNLLNLNSPDMSGAKLALIESINAYITASKFIRNETDSQADDLISIYPEDLEGEGHFKNGLLQAKDSLEENPKVPFTVEISQFVNLADIFDNPFNLRDLLYTKGLQTLLKDHLENQIDWALTNLEGPDETFNQVFDTTNYPVDEEVEVDFGDIAIGRSMLYTYRSAIKTFCAYDLNTDVYDITTKLDNETFDLKADLLNNLLYPDFLYLQPGHQLGSAKTDLNAAINSYKAGSNFIKNIETDSQLNDLITIDPEYIADEQEFLTFANAVQDSLSGPAYVGTDPLLLVDLTQFYDDPIHLKEFLPDLDANDEMIPNTFPDPTFNGILPDFNQEDWYHALELNPEKIEKADIDNDGKIDIIDIMKVAASWNKAIGDQGYDLLLDLDNDGDIDIVDIMSVATFWGWGI